MGRQRCRSGRARAAPRILSRPYCGAVNHDRRFGRHLLSPATTVGLPPRSGNCWRWRGGETNPHAYLRAVAFLCGVRLLVPVVATAKGLAGTEGRSLPTKRRKWRSSCCEAQTVAQALLAFTGLDSLQIWQERARPVAVTLDVVGKDCVGRGRRGSGDRPGGTSHACH